MRINASTVSLTSSQLDYSYNLKHEYLRKWDSTEETATTKIVENGKLSSEASVILDRLEISSKPDISQFNSKKIAPPVEQENDLIDELLDDSVEGLRMRIIKDLVEMFTGEKINILDLKKMKKFDTNEVQLLNSKDTPSVNLNNEVSNQSNRNLHGWGIDYFYKEVHSSKEGFIFSAKGNVTNEKGVEITFDASLQMNREQYSEMTVTLKAGDALIDPLVVNFSGTGIALSEKQFDFDLNADGIAEKIYFPSAGNGFLTYDKNGNGIIDNGNELFGPSSSNGFFELAQFDEDKNGWIDENDSIFSKLRVWEKDSKDNDHLYSLLEKDIGALYTGSTKTNFNLVNKDEIAGLVRETGFWLRESGGSGFLQEIDIVV